MPNMKHQKVAIPKELLFDHQWYSNAYGLNPDWGKAQIEDYYVNQGQRCGHQISPYFSPSYVIQQISSNGLAASGDSAVDFMHASNLIDPHPLLFRAPMGFAKLNPDSGELPSDSFNASIMTLRTHDTQATRHNIFFDPSYIKDDTGALDATPLDTYLRNHATTELRVSALFDPEFYLSNNVGLARILTEKTGVFQSSLQHFIMHGLNENACPIPDFDIDFYCQAYPDVVEVSERTGMSAVKHFLYHGIFEGRNPNPYFDTRFYLDAQPNVLQEVRKLRLCGPFEHFLKIGYQAGYRANTPLYSVEVPERLAKANYEKRCEQSLQTRQLVQQPIVFPTIEGTPSISCIVPVSGQGHMTIRLLEQLSEIAWRRDMPEIEVVVIDNGSVDITCDLERLTQGGVKILRSDAPLGYPGACNRGAEAATGRALVFMNNDIEVTAEAFRNGLERLDTSPEIGAVGACIIRMNGVLQEAGSMVFLDGSALGIGRDGDPNQPEYNVPREVDYCSGCFLFVRRSDFEALDGFDEAYSPGYYEEADLCFRLREKGLATLYDPRVRIYHYEYASYSKGRPTATSLALMTRNRKTFALRHRKVLAQRTLADGDLWKESWFKARYGNSLSIAVVEDYHPNRQMGSGFVRSADLVETLMAVGHRITLFVCHYMADARTELLRQKGVEIVYCFDKNVPPNPLQGHEWSFDAIWICRTHNIAKWTEHAKAIRLKNRNLKIIFDTEAVASIRDIAYRKLKGMQLNSDADVMLANELNSELRPDAIVAVNEVDRKAIERLDLAPVYELGHQMQPRYGTPKVEARRGLFFCGSFHSVASPNYDSIEWMLKEVWAKIRREVPDAELTIVGHCSADTPLTELVAQYPGVQYLGRVPSLDDLMDAARVFVAPTRFAGGIPHKVHEAMAAGLPVVCTDLLRSQLVARGATQQEVPVLSAGVSDPGAFAAACITLLQEDAKWNQLHEGNLKFIEETASQAVFEHNLKKVLEII